VSIVRYAKVLSARTRAVISAAVPQMWDGVAFAGDLDLGDYTSLAVSMQTVLSYCCLTWTDKKHFEDKWKTGKIKEHAYPGSIYWAQ